jgi:hypothetical protein
MRASSDTSAHAANSFQKLVGRSRLEHRAHEQVARQESRERAARPVPVERARGVREVPHETLGGHEGRGMHGDPQPHDEHGDDVGPAGAQLRQHGLQAEAARAECQQGCQTGAGGIDDHVHQGGVAVRRHALGELDEQRQPGAAAEREQETP